MEPLVTRLVFPRPLDAWAAHDGIDYLLYPPADGSDAPRPLLLFLHGSGERGSEIERVRLQGLPRLLDEGLELPAYILVPQCPDGEWWSPEPLLALLDEVEAGWPIDGERRLVTGLSMGGYGTWGLAQARPERFAALAPICGGGDPARACAIAALPQWIFHGARDAAVPLSESQAMVEALERCGATGVRFTVYPEGGHAIWDRVYRDEGVLEWLLAQRRAR